MLGSQNSYPYESEKTMADSILESCANAVQQQQQQQQPQAQTQQCSAGFSGNMLQDQEQIRQSQQQQQQQQRQQQQQQQQLHDRDYAAQQRENNFQLQQHEREQHLHQLQSINNLFLEPSTQPNSPIYPQNMPCSTPMPAKINSSAGFEDQISDLLNYGLTRNPIVGSNPINREPQNHKKYDSSNYSSYYQNHEDSGYSHSNNSSTLDIPSSPSSLHTPASPSTPGSVYSSQYSYSSVPSSPYTNNSVSSNGRNHQFSSPPSGRACYGRAIRGSPPYSDCSSPTTQYTSHMYNCNGSRSNSPADSDTSGSSIDGPLSDIMNCLSVNPIPHQCPTTALNTLLSEPDKCCPNNRPSLDIQRLKKLLHSSQQRQAVYHHHHHRSGGYGHFRNHHYVSPTYGSEKCCQIANHRIGISQMPNTLHSSHSVLDKAARNHRNSAAGSEVSYTWSGQLPPRTQKPAGYSPKVFCGGAPWDINEATIISTFKQFGQVKVEWPPSKDGIPQKGFFYLIMESEKQVKALLSCCTHDFSDGGSYFYKISSKRMKGKEVQVIPWNLNDSNYVKSSSQKLDPEKTVFVGALHGMITAAGLASVMNDLFDNVIYAGIDTDKFKYPIGSARVTFSSKHSFNKAVNAGFIEIKTTKFRKIIQVDPYIEDAPCSSCYVQQGPYFCREATCFKYFCHTCWQWQHASDAMSWHQPMSRGLKNNQVIGLTPNSGNMRSIKNFAIC